MQFYGPASAGPFFCCCIPGELGSTTAHVRRLPRKGRTGCAFKILLPSSPSATATTAAVGGNREELLGQRSAGCKTRPRVAADAGNRNPEEAVRRSCLGRTVFCFRSAVWRCALISLVTSFPRQLPPTGGSLWWYLQGLQLPHPLFAAFPAEAKKLPLSGELASPRR